MITRFARAAPRNDGAGHGEFHAELGVQHILRICLHKVRELPLIGLNLDALDVARFERRLGEQREHAVERPMGAVAHGEELEAKAMAFHEPAFAELYGA